MLSSFLTRPGRTPRPRRILIRTKLGVLLGAVVALAILCVSLLEAYDDFRVTRIEAADRQLALAEVLAAFESRPFEFLLDLDVVQLRERSMGACV